MPAFTFYLQWITKRIRRTVDQLRGKPKFMQTIFRFASPVTRMLLALGTARKRCTFANKLWSRYILRMTISLQLCRENQYLVFRCVNVVVSLKCPGQFTTRSAAASFQAIPRFPAYEDWQGNDKLMCPLSSVHGPLFRQLRPSASICFLPHTLFNSPGKGQEPFSFRNFVLK